jgi:hypothetical protein
LAATKVILASVVILMHLLFVLGVTEDDDVTIIEQPKKALVDITEELAGNFLIP